jgi:hypothetical protein
VDVSGTLPVAVHLRLRITGALHLMAVVGAASLLAACDNAEKERAEANRRADNAAIERLTDPLYGPTEAERLLNRVVSVRNGVIIVKGRWGGEVHAVSTFSPWTVTCGFLGVSVAFGDGEDKPEASLTKLRASPEDCETISAFVGQALNTLLRPSYTRGPKGNLRGW